MPEEVCLWKITYLIRSQDEDASWIDAMPLSQRIQIVVDKAGAGNLFWEIHKNLLAAEVSREDYAGFLLAYYGFLKPLEESLEVSAGLDELMRRRIFFQPCRGLLAQDLRTLGLRSAEIERLPVCRRLPPGSSSGQAMGILYALESSRRGQTIIARRIKQKLGLDSKHGAGFLNGLGCGDEGGGHFERFVASLNSFAVSGREEEQALRAALQTLRTIKTWLAGFAASEDYIAMRH